MSKAFKCDRCKECFDPVQVYDEDYFVTISGYIAQNGENYQNNEVKFREIENSHLCPMCAKDFIDFMDGEDQREDWYHEGFEEGVCLDFVDAFFHHLLNLGKGVEGGGDSADNADGADKTPERAKRTKKKSER